MISYSDEILSKSGYNKTRTSVAFFDVCAVSLPFLRMSSLPRQTSLSTISRKSSLHIRFFRLSGHGKVRSASTEYIHLTINSIARRQFIIQADGSICSIFSALMVASVNYTKPLSALRKSNLVICVTCFVLFKIQSQIIYLT